MFFGEEAGAIAANIGKTIKDAVSAFKADPTKLVELESTIAEATIQMQQTVIASVNATMQAEARSEHWAQWLWRPTFGFTACAVLVNNYILLPYLQPFGIVPLVIPSEVWLMVMAVLGVAAWTRGQEKISRT